MLNSNNQNIVRKRILAIILAAGLSNTLSAQTDSIQLLDTSNYIEKKILEQVNTLNNFYKTSFKIYKTNKLTRATKNDFHIEINTSDIITQNQFFDTSELNTIIILTVTHEFFHLLQYQFYNRPFKTFEPKIFESQADLLTGIYLYSQTLTKWTITHDESLSNYGGNPILAKIYRTAYSFFFKIGTNTFAKEDHPSEEQRATSVSRGILYGYEINTLYRVYNNALNDKTIDTSLLLSGFVKAFKKLNVLYNKDSIKPSLCGCYDSLLNFNELMNWSYDQSKLIVHGNIENLLDIVKTTYKLIDAYPNVIIKMTYQNFGNDTLFFVFENRMGRNNSDSAAIYTNRVESKSFPFETHFMFENNNYHSVKLFPHSSVNINDTFPLKSFSQINVSPPDAYSLFYCNSSKENSIITTQTDLTLNQKSSQYNSLLNYLKFIKDAVHRKKYSKIISTMPRSMYDLKSGTRRVEYDGVIPLNSPFKCTILRDLNTEKIFITLEAEYNKYSIADSFYNDCVHNLDFFFNLHHDEGNIIKKERIFKIKGEIGRFKSYVLSDCFVTLRFIPVNFKVKSLRHHNYYVSIDVRSKE